MSRAVAGDEEAFASLIHEYHAAMARVAYAILGEREATMDAVRSAWAIAWRRLGGWAGRGRPSSPPADPGS